MILKRSNQIYFFYCGVLIFFSVLQGCSSIAKETRPEQVSRIEIGKSTRDDVLAILGLPHKRELKAIEGDKKIEIWTYYKGSGRNIYTMPYGTVETTPSGLSYLSIYLVSLQDKERENIAAILAFDEQGLVLDLKTKGE